MTRIIAGAALALTPVATLMFRFNNPDALLVLLLVAAAYAVTRALEHARTSWLLLAGVLVGTGFLTKMLQAYLVLPAFALVYLVAAPTPMRRRIWQLLLTLGATGLFVNNSRRVNIFYEPFGVLRKSTRIEVCFYSYNYMAGCLS
jgi:4-amino-4-deoxy-L-arabinose transferase-like glycosyltransferase